MRIQDYNKNFMVQRLVEKEISNLLINHLELSNIFMEYNLITRINYSNQKIAERKAIMATLSYLTVVNQSMSHLLSKVISTNLRTAR